MSFWSIAALRAILDTETDYESPGSEELVSQLRENIEALTMLLLATGPASTCTSDPSNDANGYFYDTAAGWTDDQHNGRTLLILSGSAKGNMYTIDDTVNGSDRLDCTGDNLYADGVRSGDSYMVLYDLRSNNDGHNHDGINSPTPALGDASIVNAKLKTGTGSASGTLSLGLTEITMAAYCFFPNIYLQSPTIPVTGFGTNNADQVARLGFYDAGGSATLYAVYWRYVTASDEPCLFVLRDPADGKVLHTWMSSDFTPDFDPIVVKGGEGLIREWHRATRADGMAKVHELKNMLADIGKEARVAGKQAHEIVGADYEYDQAAKLYKKRAKVKG